MCVQGLLQAMRMFMWLTGALMAFCGMWIAGSLIVPLASGSGVATIVYPIGWLGLLVFYLLHECCIVKMLSIGGLFSAVVFDVLFVFNLLFEVYLICGSMIIGFGDLTVNTVSGVTACGMSVLMFLRMKRLGGRKRT